MATFATVDLGAMYDRSRSDASPWETRTARAVAELPGGRQRFWGVPFRLGPAEPDRPGLIVTGGNGSTAGVALPLRGHATYLVVAHFCDARARTTVAGQTADYAMPVVTAPGEHLADYVIEYVDGSTHRTPIRRRFEINQLMQWWYQRIGGFASVPGPGPMPLDRMDPAPGTLWGAYQTGVSQGPIRLKPTAREDTDAKLHPKGSWLIHALPNPHPRKRLRALRVEPTGAAAIAIGAVTRFNGGSHPLRHGRLMTLAVELPDEVTREVAAASAAVDLGVIARRSELRSFDPDTWLAARVRGRGEAPDGPPPRLSLDVAATPDATLRVAGREIELGAVVGGGATSSADGSVRVRRIDPERTWVHGRILDAATGEPLAARLHLRSADGRYHPPVGHRQDVNDGWFEDYGADVKLGDTPYAYVDGTFQGELPVGEVYYEVSRGFEYEPLRGRLEIAPGQRELEIRLARGVDRRAAGWISADTHVHFITPETARLEGQAEGLEVINLLAAQWGDMYSNVGDISGELSGSSVDDCLVWVGTENRNHFLGHIALLGVKGDPVMPMSTAGPPEGYFGDGVVRAMSEWADECRRKGGLVVIPHFPFPHSEAIAEVVRGRVDGLEFWDFWTPTMDTFAFHELYRLLDLGYRVAVVGGTDKMSAGMPVGNTRTYAHIGDDELSYDAWARAVRRGQTYTTSGPLMAFAVDGVEPGGELALPASGGRVHVDARATSVTGPIHRLEVVSGGTVVAQAVAADGATELALSESVELTGSGWLAARCVSDERAWSCWPSHLAAHTSAVYVVAGDAEPFDMAISEYLITTMQGGLTWLDTLATPQSPEHQAAIQSVFDEAIELVRGKQRRHRGG